jgi:hypothetical protein
MQFRIEVSAEPEPAACIHLPGRQLELSARRLGECQWQVRVADPEGAAAGVVGLAASDAREAIWRVARAAVRAVAELRGESVEFPAPTI